MSRFYCPPRSLSPEAAGISVLDQVRGEESVRWTWMVFRGRDAKDFLHRLTTVDIVQALSPGSGRNGCFLTVQGKIRAFFTLWQVDSNEFIFELDAGATGKWKTELKGAIEQYTFTEQLELIDRTADHECHWIFLTQGRAPDSTQGNSPLENLLPFQTCRIDPNNNNGKAEFQVFHHGSTDYGRPWLTVWSKPGQGQAWIRQQWPDSTVVPFEELEKWRIQNMGPRVDREITDAVIPFEIGLHSAVAENKGCYPGQEVIEKISSRGAAPRKLVRINGTGTPPRPQEGILLVSQKSDGPSPEVGQITSAVAEQENSFSALGVVKKNQAQIGLELRFAGSPGSVGKVCQVR